MYINSLNGEYYTIIDFNEVDIRIYLPEKVIIHRGRYLESLKMILGVILVYKNDNHTYLFHCIYIALAGVPLLGVFWKIFEHWD